jgi:phosphoglycerol transferase MdoB-like AlkP superfamily enzyme
LVVSPIYNAIDIDAREFLGQVFAFWDQSQIYKRLGFVVGFIYNTRGQTIDEPDGYGEAKIREIVAKYPASKIDSDDDINIIYIMNESFSDPTKYLADVADPIPNVHEIMNGSTRGWLATSEYGGGTANVEFEALTGFSNYFLRTVPYANIVAYISQMPSIVSRLENQGYQTTAIHPYRDTMYKRNVVYRNFGFDRFDSQADFDTAQIKYVNDYISDQTLYEKALDYLNNSDGRQFVFLLSMQNHVPYDIDYLESLRESDDAIKNLISELAKQERKTIVVFWGDHLPGIFDREQLPLPERQETPLFIWANFSSAKQDLSAISPVFLNQYVYNLAGLGRSGFDNLSSKLYKSQPVLNRQLDSVYPVADIEVLSDFEMIEYDILSGKKYSLGQGFFD